MRVIKKISNILLVNKEPVQDRAAREKLIEAFSPTQIARSWKKIRATPHSTEIAKAADGLSVDELRAYALLSRKSLRGYILHELGLYQAKKQMYRHASQFFLEALSQEMCPPHAYWHGTKNIIASGELDLFHKILLYRETNEASLDRNKTATLFSEFLLGKIDLENAEQLFLEATRHSEDWSAKALSASLETLINQNCKNIPADYLLRVFYLYLISSVRINKLPAFEKALRHLQGVADTVTSDLIGDSRYLIECLSEKAPGYSTLPVLKGVVKYLAVQGDVEFALDAKNEFTNHMSFIVPHSYNYGNREVTKEIVDKLALFSGQKFVQVVQFLYTLYDPKNKHLYNRSFGENFKADIYKKNMTVSTSLRTPSTMLSTPRVSIVIPSYNAAQFIGLTLKSVKMQTLENFECIIVNDASTDDSAAIIRQEISGDVRFKVVTNKLNSGLSASRNTGLRCARGKFICFLDADDLLMTDSIERRSQTLLEVYDPFVIGTYSGSMTIKEETIFPPKSTPKPLKAVDFFVASGNCPFNANQPMFITEKLRKEGGFDETLKQAEDYEFWMRLMRLGYYFLPTQSHLVTYRQRSGSMIRENPLLHLSTSCKWFHMNHQKTELPATDVYFDKPWFAYKIQMDISNRVLEFAGIALAKGEDSEKIANIIAEQLPDFERFVSRHRNFRERCRIGYERYIGTKIEKMTQWEVNYCNVALLNLEMSFYKTLRQLNVDITNDGKITKNLLAKPFDINTFLSSKTLRSDIDIAFIPHKTYHVKTIQLLQKELLKRKIRFVVIDISQHYRDEGVRDSCKEFDIPMVGYNNWVLSSAAPKVLISFNDWDPIIRSIFLKAQEVGIKTVSIVEGIQDYHDVDTKQLREAYRSADVVFLSGAHDKKYFAESKQKLIELGVPRIIKLRQTKSSIRKRKKKIVLINSNFSYGVLEKSRDTWLEMAVNAVISAGHKPVITKHPADLGALYSNLVTTDDFYTAVKKCDIVISRFASAILESMAMNRPVVYLKPATEYCDKFNRPNKAYKIVRNERQLLSILENIDLYRNETQTFWYDFLENHCGKLTNKFEKIFADHIEEVLHSMPEDTERDELFKSKLLKNDQNSMSLNKISELRSINLAKYGAFRHEICEHFNYDLFELASIDIMNPEHKNIIQDVELHRRNIDVQLMYSKK